MKIDFNAPVKALNGEDRKDEKGDIFKLKDACVMALDRALEDEVKKLDAKEKYRRGHLAKRIYGAAEPIALDIEDIALIKGLVGKIFNSNLIITEVWDMLDPKDGQDGGHKPCDA
jgi:hypothetical protein